MQIGDNVRLVETLFDAFGRGDIPVVLEMLAPDVEWQSPVTRITDRENISWAEPRRSRDEVARFFKEMGAKTKPRPFNVRGYMAQGDKVVVEGSNAGTVPVTGRGYEHDWVMVFTVSGGLITGCRHYYDSADLEAAFREP